MAETLLPAIAATQPEPAPQQPTIRPWVHFNIQDIPLPLPGSLAAMTDAELDLAHIGAG